MNVTEITVEILQRAGAVVTLKILVEVLTMASGYALN